VAQASPGRVEEKPAPLGRVRRYRVNGRAYSLVEGRDLEASTTLAYLLRERLGLTGLKVACGEGACGACTVIVDGKAVPSCLVLAVEVDGSDILTVEGLAGDDPVVTAFATQCEPGYGTALQCGYCTPGFVMTARALLDRCPHPSGEEIEEALAGNVCRCGCYAGIARAVLRAGGGVER
jgi:aerobic-type carbon monoxide dehydrogenase small subunit (CoxS/CutS family)